MMFDELGQGNWTQLFNIMFVLQNYTLWKIC